MTVEVKVPDELEDGGDVLDVFVNAGDTISVGQGLVEVETDKAAVEVESTHAGKVLEVRVQAGDALKPGDVIVVLEATSANESAAAPTSPEPAVAPAATPESAPRAEPAVSADPEAATATPESPATPSVATPPSAPATPAPPPVPARTPSSAASAESTTAVPLAPASPSVRRFAREVGVNLSGVVGTGLQGRILREDVLAVVRSTAQAQSAPAQSASSSESSSMEVTAEAPATSPETKVAEPKARKSEAEGAKLPGEASTDKWGPVQIEKMPKIRKTIAKKMHESWSTVPRVTNFDDADVTELEAMRQASKADYAKSGIKLTTMPFIIKACALALKSNPLINAAIDMENEQIIYKQYVNVGVAVDTSRGLVVPSLRAADQLSIPAIARALGSIAASAREGNFSVDDLRGSTFTISNLGAIGGTYSTPIINTPEVAILLVGRARKMPVVVDDEVKIRLMMPLSLSYDHRLVDGGAAARFLNDIIGFLSMPSRLLIAP